MSSIEESAKGQK